MEAQRRSPAHQQQERGFITLAVIEAFHLFAVLISIMNTGKRGKRQTGFILIQQLPITIALYATTASH